MAFFLSKFFQLEDRICQPNPKFIPDNSQRQELYHTNRAYIRSIIYFLLVYPIISIILNFRYEDNIYWLTHYSLHLICAVCFCRAKVWLWHLAYTTCLTILPFLFVKYTVECFFHALLTSTVTPVFIMQVTKSLRLVGVNFIFQIIILKYQYRPLLTEAVINMTSQGFSDKMIDTIVIFLFNATLTYTLRLKASNDIHNQLALSKDKIEETYSQLQLFLQTFSHELRNPLNSLLGNLQLVLQEKLPPKVHEMVVTSKVCSELLLQLINNILDTGKAQIGKLDVNPTPTRVIDFVAGVWRISRDLIKRKNLNGFLKIDNHLPPILHIDFYRVNQILLNLIGNALKFTDKGQIWIKLDWLPDTALSEQCFMPYPYHEDGKFEKDQNIRTMHRSNRSSDFICYLDSGLESLNDLYLNSVDHEIHGVLKIIVKDTGCGINEEDLKMLFGKFSQVGDDHSKRVVGTGLGLYITKAICESMGGQIKAFSKRDQGTTFIACIPTYYPKQNEGATNVQQLTLYLQRMRLQVLIADNDTFSLDLLSNYIKKIDGRVVDVAKTCKEGGDKYTSLRRLRKDLKILFINIDKQSLDGKSICTQVRQFEVNENLYPVKIVLITADYDEVQMNMLLDKRGDFRGNVVLKKPVSFDNFINVLGNIFT